MPVKKNASRLAMFILVSTLVACGKKDAPTPPPIAPPPAAPKVAAPAAPAPAAPAPPVPGAAATPAAAKTDDAPLVRPEEKSGATPENFDTRIQGLQTAVNNFCGEFKRVPKDFNEVVKGGFLKAVPTAPGGKTYVIDQTTAAVTAK